MIVALALVATLSSPAASVRPLWHMGRQICTASSINEKIGLWLTAYHCVNQGLPEVEDRSDPSRPFHPTSLVWFNQPEDLAVLFTAGLRVTALTLAAESPHVGNLVQSYQHPLMMQTVQYVQGYVSAHETRLIGDDGTVEYGTRDMFGLPVCQGASGSAILNEWNQIVSVVQLGPGTPCAPITGGARFPILRQYIARFFE
jgi:hypothetical protein